LKRLALCLFLCILAVPAAFPQQQKDRGGGFWNSVGNFFSRTWNGFTETLFTPQIHKPFSVAGGIEMTQNEREGLLPELFVISDYELTPSFGLGLRGGMTFGSKRPDDRLVSVMEGVFFGRFYVCDFGWIKPYVQTGVGISIDQEMEYEYMDVLGEFALGVRAHWKGWFMDAGFRGGYPFRTAFGLSFGHSFLP
jgi:hypothetical protein